MSLNRRHLLKAAVGLMAGGTLTPFTAFGSRRSARVIVVGAGLAGLNCARHLQHAGYEPVVLEASDIAGGRTRSIKVGDTTINLGGIEIGDGYQRFLSLARDLKLEPYQPAPSSRDLTIYQNGTLIHSKDWSNSGHNPLPESIKATLPPQLQFAFHRNSLPLKNTEDWLSPEFSEFDVTEAQRLKQLGADFSALELIERAGNFNSLDSMSSLHYLRSIANYQFGGSTSTLRLSGGNDQLALALAKRTPQLFTQHNVSRLVETDKGIELDCTNGSSWIAEKVVLALPFSVLRKIDMRLDLPAIQRQAIEKLPYTKISKLVMRVEKPFWEHDGLPPNMWCNSELERTFLSTAENGDLLYTVFINGNGTDVVDALSDQQAVQWVRKELERTRPSTRGALIPLVYKSWGNDPLALGAYHAFGPGQITAFANAMVRPTKRIYFAGEHCARAEPGMEGALESGEIAARQIIN